MYNHTSDTQYDIIFIDPPYGKCLIEETIISLYNKKIIQKGALLILELGSREKVTLPHYCSILDERIYGRSKMMIVTI